MNQPANITLQNLLNESKPLIFKKGERIIREDDEDPLHIYYLLDGHVRIYLTNEKGEEVTFDILQPGLIFPLTNIINSSKNSFCFEAFTKSVVKKISREKIFDLMKKDHSLAIFITEQLNENLKRFINSTHYLTFSRASKKILWIFYLYSQRVGEKYNDKKVIINLPLTHKDIASLVGLSRETVSREITQLEKTHFLSKKKNFFVINNINTLLSRLGG